MASNSGWFTLDISAVDSISEKISEYGNVSNQIVSDELHGRGSEEIKNRITTLLPVSEGKGWTGKPAHAKDVMPGEFSQDNAPLAVTVAARGTYHYLYFPDDGSNTKNHRGNKHFMQKGAENAQDVIIENITDKLIERFGE